MTATMAAKKPGKKRGPKTDRNAIEQYERKKQAAALRSREIDRKSTRLNSSHT